MKVIVQKANRQTEEELITVDDEMFDNPVYVTITIGNKSADVSVVDLDRALLPFLSKYHEDKQYNYDEI